MNTNKVVMKKRGDRRDLEQVEPSRTQAAAINTTHGGADGGRSHVGGRADDSGGANRRQQNRLRRSPRWKADVPG